jgi:hypothetical protein
MVSWKITWEGRGTHRGFTRLSGPVRVIRTEAGWKIADYVREGRLRSTSVVLGPTPWVAGDSIRARVLRVDLGGRTTDVDLEVENQSDHDRSLGSAWFAERLVGPVWRWYPAQRSGARQEFPAREVIRTHLGIDRAFPKPPTELRLLLPLFRFESKRWIGFDLRLAVNNRIEVTSAASGTMRIPRALRLQFWAIRVTGVVVVGLIAWWLLAR